MRNFETGRRTPPRAWLPILTLALLTAPIPAQPVANVTVTKIALDGGRPGSVFASTGRGLLRSVDGGQRYEPVALKPLGQRQPLVTALIVQPGNPKNLFLGTEAEDGGVWKSIDGGVTWAVANKGLPAVAAPIDLLQWVESNQALYVKAGTQVFKSEDGAETWTLRGELPPQANTLAISPADPRWMYAAQASGGLYRSRDEGASWTVNQNNVPGLSGSTVVTHMLVDPKNPAVGYVAASGPVLANSNGSGIYKSGDLTSEAGWAFSVIPDTLQRLRPLRLYSNGAGGLFATSRVPGEIYRNRCALVSNASEASVQCSDPSAGFDRICVNPDRNSPPGGCVSGNRVLDIAVDPSEPQILWAAATNGIFQSRPSLITGIGSEWASRFGFAKATLATPELPYTFNLPEGENGRLRLRVGAAETDDWRLPVTVTPGGEKWLTLSPSVDRTPATIAVEVSTAGLAPGDYASSIEIRSSDAVNSPVTIPVRLKVLGAARATHTISKAGGLGVPGNFGDNGPAGSAAIGEVDSLAADTAGNLFLSDLTYNVVRRIDAEGRITRWAGTGQLGTSGDDGPAVLATFRRPRGLAADEQGRLYIADGEGRRIRRVSPDGGTISLVFDIESNLRGLATDGQGSVYVAVPSSHAIGKVTAEGQLSVVTGIGIADFRGDGFPARTARLAAPLDVAADGAGNIYIADTENNRIRKIDTGGIIRTIAGNGLAGYQGDAAKATDAALDRPSGIAVDKAGNVFFTETEGHRVRMVTAAGALRTIAGIGTPGMSELGAASAANLAPLRAPSDVAVAADGSVYVADTLNYRILKLTPVPVEIVPELSATPVVNPVDGRAAVAPGGLFRVLGTNLATAASAEPPYPVTLGDAQVFINDIAAPLSMSSAGEIAGQVPFEIAPGHAKLRVVFKGKPSMEAMFTVSPTAPALLTNGAARVLAIQEDGSLNGAGNAANAGAEVRVFITGQGVVDPALASGVAASDEPFSRPTAPVKARLGDSEAKVLDAILLPGFVGLTEVRIAVPGELEAGEYELTITAGDSESGRAGSEKPKLLVARPE